MKQAAETSFDIVVFLSMFIVTAEPALWIIGLLIFTDTLTGIWGAIKTKGLKSIRSRKLGRIITKIILYPLAILVAHATEQVLTPSVPWETIVVGIIATVELKSIYEKMGVILGYDLWRRIKKEVWKEKEIGE